MGSTADPKSWPNDRFRDALQDTLRRPKLARKSKQIRLIFVGGAACAVLLSGGLILVDCLGSRETTEPRRPIVHPKPILYALPPVTAKLPSSHQSGAQVRPLSIPGTCCVAI